MNDKHVMDKKIKAIILMILSATSFSFMAASVKMTGDLPPYQAVFFRNIVSLMIAFMAVYRKDIHLLGKKENRKYLIFRSLCGLLGVNCFFYAIPLMPLANSNILNKTSPVFVLIFAGILLKEKITKTHIMAVIIAMTGVVLVVNPQAAGVVVFPSLIALLGACCAGLAYTIVRFLGDKEHPSTIIFWFSCISVLGMLPFVLVTWQTPSPLEWVFLILTGVFAAGGQYGLTFAYRYAPAGEVSIYSYTTIIFSALIGVMVWKESLNLTIILGGLLIIVSGVINYRIKKVKE